MQVASLDHLVLTVADVGASVAFYTAVLGMGEVVFGDAADPRYALTFGSSKINLHQRGREFEPKARRPTPGSADVCLVVATKIEEVVAELGAQGIAIDGPYRRTGALGPITLVYIRDPDGNLIELANY